MDSTMEEQPRDMSLSDLAKRSRGEIAKHRRGEVSDDRYCLEILRRAMAQRDHFAWDVLQQIFSEIVMNWMHCHPCHQAALRHDSEENYVARAFARFWRATINNPRLEFVTLGAALSFLYASLNGAIIDELRAYARPKEVPLEIDDPDEGHVYSRMLSDASHMGPLAPEPDDDSEVWQILESMLSNEREHRVAYLLYYCNLKPRDIIRFCRDEFDSVQEIYRLRRNILERIQRNLDRFRWLRGDDV